jgi:hypothetical protein
LHLTLSAFQNFLKPEIHRHPSHPRSDQSQSYHVVVEAEMLVLMLDGVTMAVSALVSRQKMFAKKKRMAEMVLAFRSHLHRNPTPKSQRHFPCLSRSPETPHSWVVELERLL